MAVLLFVLALLCAGVLGVMVVENTDPSEVTLLTQTITGFTEGSFLFAAGALGFLTALLLMLSLMSTRRSRNRRRKLRSARKDLAARVSELEAENARLRQALEHAEAPAASWEGDTERAPGQREPSPPARPAGTRPGAAGLSPPPPPPPPGRGGNRPDDLRAEAIALLREEEGRRQPPTSRSQPLPEETEPVVRLRDFRSPGGGERR